MQHPLTSHETRQPPKHVSVCICVCVRYTYSPFPQLPALIQMHAQLGSRTWLYGCKSALTWLLVWRVINVGLLFLLVLWVPLLGYTDTWFRPYPLLSYTVADSLLFTLGIWVFLSFMPFLFSFLRLFSFSFSFFFRFYFIGGRNAYIIHAHAQTHTRTHARTRAHAHTRTYTSAHIRFHLSLNKYTHTLGYWATTLGAVSMFLLLTRSCVALRLSGLFGILGLLELFGLFGFF